MAEDGSNSATRYQVSDVIVDFGQRQVQRGDELLQLGGLTFDLLRVLVESAPNVVPHEELAEKVWSGRPVSPETITQRAVLLRQALDDHPENPKYFEVVRGHGFRLIPDVVPAKSARESTWRRALSLMAAGLVVIAVAVFALYQSAYEDQNTIQPNSVAVLPFVNMSSDPDNAYFADGLSEELLNALANTDGLTVIARTSSFQFRNRDIDIRDIGRTLNVANVLEGSVRVSGATIRITAQLVQSQSGAHLWSETFDRPMEDVFAVQDEIARNVAAALRSTLGLEPDTPVPVSTTENAVAYGYYLKARALLHNSQQDNFLAVSNAINNLNAAVELDPEFSDAIVALMDAYFALANIHHHQYRPDEAQRASASAEKAAKQALEFTPRTSETLRALGMMTGRPALKVQVFRRAVERNPNNVLAYGALAKALIARHDLEEGFEVAEKYHSLDPLSVDSAGLMAHVLVMQGRLKEASDYFRKRSRLGELPTGNNNSPSTVPPDRLLAPSKQLLDRKLEAHLDLKLNSECRDNFQLSVSSVAYTGEKSAYLSSLPDAVGWCGASSVAAAQPFRGKYLKLVGMVRTRDSTGDARLWMRVDGSQSGWVLGFDNGPSRFFTGTNTDWRPFEVALYVPDDAYVVAYGGTLSGEGEFWMDDFRFYLSDDPDFD